MELRTVLAIRAGPQLLGKCGARASAQNRYADSFSLLVAAAVQQ
jgi:hypothetical protein